MLRIVRKLVPLLCIGTLLTSCSDDYTYVVQMKDATGVQPSTPVVYLGIEVGLVETISFGEINGTDFVFLSLTLSEPLLYEKSQVLINPDGKLEIINQIKGATLNPGDTLKMEPTSIEHPIPNEAIQPVDSKLFTNEEVIQKLTPEEKAKADSLQMKINKLNELIKEVNGSN